jgi:hypothetical protein
MLMSRLKRALDSHLCRRLPSPPHVPRVHAQVSWTTPSEIDPVQRLHGQACIKTAVLGQEHGGVRAHDARRAQ